MASNYQALCRGHASSKDGNCEGKRKGRSGVEAQSSAREKMLLLLIVTPSVAFGDRIVTFVFLLLYLLFTIFGVGITFIHFPFFHSRSFVYQFFPFISQPSTMKSSILALAASLSTPALGTFVVQCYSRLIDERADPVVSPGVASGHVHTIAGGSGFNFTMNYKQAKASQCSTCNIYSDLSNYWTPKLYFHAQNGSFLSVPIIGDNDGGNMGGMAIYYL